MKRKIKIGLIAAFLTGGIVLMLHTVINKPRVLVLQSYYPDYSWTRDVDAGLKRVLGKDSRVSLRWYYMDTKRHPWPDFKEKAGVAARRTIDDWQPDVIIAVDDDAQQYVARHYAGHPKINIVFSGVNNEMATYGYDKVNNVSGILERQNLDAVKGAMLSIAESKGWKGPIKVINLGDSSETVKGDARAIGAYEWAPLVFMGSRLVTTFDDWKHVVIDEASRANFILTTNYRGLVRTAQERTLVPASEVVHWTEDNAWPLVIGTYGFYVEEGGALSIAVSPYEQGEVAARKALEILGGRKPKDIPVEITRQFVVFMRGAAMKAKGLDLPPIYEAFARATRNYIE